MEILGSDSINGLTVKKIYIFINELKRHGGAIWLDKDALGFFAPPKFQNDETRDFITSNKPKIKAILDDNQVFSRERFDKLTIYKNSAGNRYPLSFSQERLWFIEQYEQGSNAYHIPLLLELNEQTSEEGIRYALQQVVDRHQVLRSTIEYGEDEGIQVVHDAPLAIVEVVLSEGEDYHAVLGKEINRPFNLEKEYPVRALLYRLGSGSRRLLLVNLHHIACDGWSVGIFERELLSYYKAYERGDMDFRLEALEIQYKDYAWWQKHYLNGDVLAGQLSYWKDKLSGFQVLDLATDYVRPSRVDYRGGVHDFRISVELSDRLRSLASRYGVTLHSVLLSGLHVLLSKYSGQDDIVTGSPMANRHHRQTEGLIGFFVNTQVNRSRLSKLDSYRDLIQQVHNDQVLGQQHQDIPFERLVDELGVERDASRHAVFQVMFSTQSFRQDAETRNDQRRYFKVFGGLGEYSVEKFDLSISVVEGPGELTGQVSYASSLFGASTIARLAGHYVYLLNRLTSHPGESYSRIGLLDGDEYDQVVHGWNQTDRPYRHDQTIHSLFVEQVIKTPDQVALVYEGNRMSYSELNARSNQVARALRSEYKKRTKRALEADTLVGLCMDRSLEMVISMLGILKAGGAYVPIDPSYPQDRIDYLLADTGACLVLTQRKLSVAGVVISEDKAFYVDLSEDIYRTTSSDNLSSYSAASDLAYVIYTSGTTGKPKGVMVEHRSVNNLTEAQRIRLEMNPSSRVLQFASLVFDASVWEIFTALCNGAELHILPGIVRQDAHMVGEYIGAHAINITLLPPVLLNELTTGKFDDLRTLVVGGEVGSAEMMKRWSAGRKLINAYGPTEATVCVSMHDFTDGDLSTNIGSPLPNTKLYVLDSDLNPVPMGVRGELYIGGACLARGYLNRLELTADRFIKNRFASASDMAHGYDRLYKTGDVVRWQPDGNLEYLGRNDSQVKIRGYRIELGEIEQAMLRLEGVKQSCVLARERKGSGGRYLIGYYTGEGRTWREEEIRQQLSLVLPDYMVPSMVLELASFPLTINGKLDKDALPEGNFSMTEEYVSPSSEWEKVSCRIWEEVLGVERVGVTDNFFRIGGNSILAIQVSHRMSKALDRYVKVSDIFDKKSIGRLLSQSLGAQIEIQRTDSMTGVLSFSQERLWFIEQYEQGSNASAYHLPLVYEIPHHTDVEGVKYALSRIVARHEVLRSTIKQQHDQVHAVQIVHERPLEIDQIFLSTVEEFEIRVRQAINDPFDLSREFPIRVKLYIVGSHDSKNRTFLLINTHHIATDGWSMKVFQSELLEYYRAFIAGDKSFCLPDLGIQYRDFAAWQRKYVDNEVLAEQLGYWKQKLSGFQVLNLSTDYVRPKEVNYAGSSQVFVIDKLTSEKLRVLTQRLGTTLHCVMMSGTAVLMSKYTGQDDIVIGSSIANRQHHQTERLIGFFVNTQANRIVLGETQSFESLIQQTHNDQVEAQLYQDLPFERLVDELGVERDPSRHPVFQVFFEMQTLDRRNKDAKPEKGILIAMEVAASYEVEKFDLSIHIDDSLDELVGSVSYSTSLFSRDTIDRLIGHFKFLMGQLADAPDKLHAKVGLISPEEYDRTIRKWNDTVKEYSSNKTIGQLFQDQAARSLDNIALISGDVQVTYRDLNEKSNQLARHIRTEYLKRTSRELTPDTFIAVCLNRGAEMVVGVLAVLKAGAAYVPIDPKYPADRIDYLLEDTQAELILSQDCLADLGVLHGVHSSIILFIDLHKEIYQTFDRSDLPTYSQPTDLAYVIYTSGTTGRPKGAMIEHIGMINHMEAMIDKFNLGPHSRLAQNAPQSFDVSVWQMFTCLMVGGQTVIYDDNIILATNRFLQKITEDRVTVLEVVPSYLSVLLDEVEFGKTTGGPVDLTHLIVTGESVSHSLVSRWFRVFPGITMVNAYGPAEASDDITLHFMQAPPEQRSIPIGQCVQNLNIYIVDGNRNICPVGVAGEIWVSGVGVGRGYLGDEEKTKRSFIPDPFIGKDNVRLYKTGDIGRYLPDGSLEFLGRRDHMVKIRGFRIELGEIEHALLSIDGIAQACVLAKDRQAGVGSKFLVGYYTPDHNMQPPATSVVLQKLARVLPEYMLPDSVMQLESFPLNINGKIDRRLLPDPDFKANLTEHVDPVSDAEITASVIWKEALGLERIGITDDFFKVGGNSILAIRVARKMSAALGIDVRVADIFRSKSIGQLLLASKLNDGPVKPYHAHFDPELSNVIFVPPANCGSEVYQVLAQRLKNTFNCIGIDYTIDNNSNLDSLSAVASFYLAQYEGRYSLIDGVILFGWSLGGQIALEMASALESRGYENIRVILLDTFVGDRQTKHHSQLNSNAGITSAFGHDVPVGNTVAHVIDIEEKLAACMISNRLESTEVILFKATRFDWDTTVNGNTPTTEYLKSLEKNNVDQVADRIRVVNVDCVHLDIIASQPDLICDIIKNSQTTRH